MIKLLLLAFGTWALASAQDYEYVYDYADAPQDPGQPQHVQPVAAPPPIQQVSRGRAPSSQPRARPQQSRPAAQQVPRGEFSSLNDPSSTPVPILIDSRSIDTKTGAFVYQYAGADGSEKHEYRYPNGTVIGNYTFINDLGERETRFYSAGVHDPTLVDETTDPNYVDLGNYELYKHLEQAYVHNDGTSSSSRDRDVFSQQASPRPQSRPSPRQQASRPRAPPPPPVPVAPTFEEVPIAQAPLPIDFEDRAVFDQRPQSHSFDYEDVAVAAPVAPVPPPAPLPQGPPFRGPSTRGRVSGGRGQGVPRPRHRLDISNQSPLSELDSIISQFQ